MMGCHNRDQGQLFYAFNLDQHVPDDHLLRRINQHVCFDGLRSHLADYYSHTGRPSIDPELMIRILIIGYCYGIRSERRLCEELHLNLAYRWFCRLGLEDAVPDHSTFSKSRHGRFHDSELFRWVFDQVVKQCIDSGLVKGEGFAVDASTIRADVSGERHARLAPDKAHELESRRHLRAVREYLQALEQDPDNTPPNRQLSKTDPQSRWTATQHHPAIFAYSTKVMINRVEEKFDLKPDRLMGDTAYGTAPMLGWLVDEKGIAPHIPVWDKSKRKDGTLSAEDFKWNEADNEYRCPEGNALRHMQRNYSRPRTGTTSAQTKIYYAPKANCDTCPLKPRCCPNTPARKITRSVHEAARDAAKRIAKTPEYKESRRERKKVEMQFAHLKRILKLDRLRLRGINGANDEFLLAATAQNPRRMARLCAQGPPECRTDASAG